MVLIPRTPLIVFTSTLQCKNTFVRRLVSLRVEIVNRHQPGNSYGGPPPFLTGVLSARIAPYKTPREVARSQAMHVYAGQGDLAMHVRLVSLPLLTRNPYLR